MSETAQTAIQRHSTEDYEKCLEAFKDVSCELCDLLGSLMILDDYLDKCDPLYLDKEDFYPVFRGIVQAISSTTETVKQLNKNVGDALNEVV